MPEGNSHARPESITLPGLSPNLTPSQSLSSSQSSSPHYGSCKDNLEKPDKGLEADALSWLNDHEKDEAHIARLGLIAQRRCREHRKALAEAGIKGARPHYLHGPTYSAPDTQMIFLDDTDSDGGAVPTSSSSSGHSGSQCGNGEYFESSELLEMLQRGSSDGGPSMDVPQSHASERGDPFFEQLSKELGISSLGLLGLERGLS